jgi:steroid delta-isomerase-like uncharacterized protein
MSTAQATSNKATFRRFQDAVGTGDADVISKMIDELVEPDVLIHMPIPIEATGAQALKQVWATLLRGLPDLDLTIEDLLEEGDKVVIRNTVTGTHQGEYMGIPPTGKSVTYNEIFIFRFAGGRIAETWGVVDVFSQMKQLGVLPATSTWSAQSRPCARDRTGKGCRHSRIRVGTGNMAGPEPALPCADTPMHRK